MTHGIIDQGKRSYGYYCVQCHGRRLDGKATVGQSFYPLPTDLLDPKVQAQTKEIFYKISLGTKTTPLYHRRSGRPLGHHPIFTVSWSKKNLI